MAKKRMLALLFATMCLGLSACQTSVDGLTIDISGSVEVDDTKIKEIYELYKANGGTLTYDEWIITIKGENGKDGFSLLTGSGTPGNSLGNVGDTYLDIETWDMYTKATGSWIKVGNIKGIQGKDGEPGPTGNGISNIHKISSDGDLDTYEIELDDGSTYTFTVPNDSRSKTIVDTYIDQNNHFIIVFSDGSSYDTGDLFIGEHAQDGFDYYPQDDGTYAIGVGKNVLLSELTIPTIHNGKRVTAIAANGFQNSRVINLTIPDGIETIMSYAFNRCDYLKNLYIPNSVTAIGDGAFTFGQYTIINYNEYDGGRYLGNSTNPYYCCIQNGNSFHPDCKIAYAEILINPGTYTINEGLTTVSMYTYAANIDAIIVPHSIRSLKIRRAGPPSYITSIIYDGTEEDWNSLILNIDSSLLIDTTFIFHETDHIFSDGYAYDSNTHWHPTICGHNAKKDEEPHSFGSWDIINQPTINNDGLKQRTCSVCGYLDQQAIDRIDIYDYTLLSDDTYEISINEGIDKNQLTGELVIPRTYNNKLITSIGSFKNCNYDSIIIPDSVTNVSSWAFLECHNIKSIVIPSGVNYVGAGAFAACGKLKYIALPSTLTHLEHNTLLSCDNPVIFYGGQKDELDNLGNENNNYSVFYSNIDVETLINYRDNTESYALVNGHNIYEYKYLGNSSMVNLTTLGNNAKSLGKGAFKDVLDVHYIVLPNTIEYIDENVFNGASNLEQVTFYGTEEEWNAIEKNDLWNIGSSDYHLVFAPVPEHVHTYSEEWSKDDTHHWHNATCGHDVVGSYGLHEFSGWSIINQPTYEETGLKEHTCSICGYKEQEVVPVLEEYLEYFLLPDMSYGVKVGQGKYLEHIVIPSTHNGLPVTRILDSAFENSHNLRTIDIPDSVTIIDERAFCGCENLEEIELSNNVITIGSNAFNNCISLTEITIPGSVSVLSSGVFFGCSGLTTITIEEGVERIEDSFGSNTNLTNLYIPLSINYWYGTYGSTNMYYGGDIVDWCAIEGAFSGGTNHYFTNEDGDYYLVGEELIIPEGVEIIPERRFISFSITSLTLPESIKRIEIYAFNGTNLTSLSIPDGIEYVSSVSFQSYDGSGAIDTHLCNYIDNGYYFGNSSNPYLVLVKVSGGNHTTQSTCKIVADLNFYWSSINLDITSNVKYIYVRNNHNMTNGGTTYSPIYYLGTIDDLEYCVGIVPIYSETQPTDTTHIYWHGTLNSSTRTNNSLIWH